MIELNGTLKELIKLASSSPAKSVEELSEMMSKLSLVVIDIHLNMSKMAESKKGWKEEALWRVVAPIVIGVVLYLFLDLGPAIIKILPAVP